MKPRVLIAVTALLLVASACGDDGTPTTLTTEPGTTAPGTSAPNTTSATTTSTTTTTAPNTTSTVPAVPEAAGYVVTGVATDDVLNVRSGPGVEHAVIATLEPGATGVLTTGLATEDLVSDGWWEVRTGAGAGWVNSSFLALPAQWSAPVAEIPCFSASGGLAGSGLGADHVLAVEHLSSPECERLVILLGRDAFQGSEDWPLFPAASLPGASIKSFADLRSVTISLPPTVADVRPTATERNFGAGRSFVVRRADGGLDVKLHFSDEVEAQVFGLESPARIVVDVRLTPSETGEDLLGAIGPRAALAARLDPRGEGLTTPVAIRGYARPFEAQGVVMLLEAADPPGTGAPVTATWAGGLGPTTGSDYGYMTTDWVGAWGAFEVTLVDTPAGSYDLFVGEFSAEDGEPVGLYERLTIVDGS